MGISETIKTELHGLENNTFAFDSNNKLYKVWYGKVGYGVVR